MDGAFSFTTNPPRPARAISDNARHGNQAQAIPVPAAAPGPGFAAAELTEADIMRSAALRARGFCAHRMGKSGGQESTNQSVLACPVSTALRRDQVLPVMDESDPTGDEEQ